jgi:hypothetical protein
MGGGQSLNFGLGNLDTFAWVGGFSSAPNTKRPADLIKDHAEASRKLKLLYVACGDKDVLFRISEGVHKMLDENKVPHEYRVIPGGGRLQGVEERPVQFAQLVFRDAEREKKAKGTAGEEGTGEKGDDPKPAQPAPGGGTSKSWRPQPARQAVPAGALRRPRPGSASSPFPTPRACRARVGRGTLTRGEDGGLGRHHAPWTRVPATTASTATGPSSRTRAAKFFGASRSGSAGEIPPRLLASTP